MASSNLQNLLPLIKDENIDVFSNSIETFCLAPSIISF